jgi:chromosome segregation ATPase
VILDIEGNPISDIKDTLQYVIYMMPQLEVLNRKVVSSLERSRADERYGRVSEEELRREIERLRGQVSAVAEERDVERARRRRVEQKMRSMRERLELAQRQKETLLESLLSRERLAESLSAEVHTAVGGQRRAEEEAATLAEEKELLEEAFAAERESHRRVEEARRHLAAELESQRADCASRLMRERELVQGLTTRCETAEAKVARLESASSEAVGVSRADVGLIRGLEEQREELRNVTERCEMAEAMVAMLKVALSTVVEVSRAEAGSIEELEGGLASGREAHRRLWDAHRQLDEERDREKAEYEKRLRLQSEDVRRLTGRCDSAEAKVTALERELCAEQARSRDLEAQVNSVHERAAEPEREVRHAGSPAGMLVRTPRRAW